MNKQIKQRINNLEDELAALKEELKVPEKGAMLECSDGGYYLSVYNGVLNGPKDNVSRSIGAEYMTKEEAEQAAKLRTQLEVINNIIRQLNKEDGFIADWGDLDAPKYLVYYDYQHHSWQRISKYRTRTFGAEYCSKETATYLAKMINDGLVNGISKHWELLV